MKKLSSLVMGACFAAACLTSGVAQSGTTAMGTVCRERYPYGMGLVFSNSSVLSGNYTQGTTVTCPISVDHDLGSTADFSVVVSDNSTTYNYACYGVAYDAAGVLKGTSATKYSSGSSGTSQTLSMSISGVDPLADWSFAVVCDIPEYSSQILSLRAY